MQSDKYRVISISFNEYNILYFINLNWLKNRLKTVLTDNWKFNVYSNSCLIKHHLYIKLIKSISQQFCKTS